MGVDEHCWLFGPASRVGRVLAPVGSRVAVTSALAFAVALTSSSRLAAGDHESDRLKELQTSYVASASQKMARAYHFGSQGAGDVFSNHTSHTNRLVPVYVFGRKADLAAVTGANSRYRDPEKIKATLWLSAREYGQPPGRLRRPERPVLGAEGGRRPRGQSTCSSSGSTVWTGRPRRPRRLSKQARFTPRARDRA